ncbi:MAG: hypothetical protein ACI8VE_000617, partial [Natrialbaceae archaeon]
GPPGIHQGAAAIVDEVHVWFVTGLAIHVPEALRKFCRYQGHFGIDTRVVFVDTIGH